MVNTANAAPPPSPRLIIIRWKMMIDIWWGKYHCVLRKDRYRYGLQVIQVIVLQKPLSKVIALIPITTSIRGQCIHCVHIRVILLLGVGDRLNMAVHMAPIPGNLNH